MKRNIFFVLSFIVLSASSQVSKSFETEVTKLKSDEAIKNGSWSISVYDVTSSKLVYDYNSNQSLIPASTLKVLTTAAALEILGEDFTFETNVEYDGEIVGGVLKGNLYIKGSGDPSLASQYFKSKTDSSNFFNAWVEKIKQAGIKKVEGSVIADGRAFEQQHISPEWVWGDIGNYYAAGAYALNYRDNKYTIYYDSGSKEGDSVKIKKVYPEQPNLKFYNQVVSGGTGDFAYIYGSPYNNYRIITGTIPVNKKDYEVDGSFADPALQCANDFKAALEESKITVQGSAENVFFINKKSSLERKKLFSYKSPTLDKLVYFTNLKSDNLYAESFLKAIALRKKGFGSISFGIEVLEEYLKSKNISTDGLYLADGCGLSRANGITTAQLAQLLTKISKEKYFNIFLSSLPVSGKSGSMANFGKGTFLENNMKAKTGYINRVRSYCGYFKDKKGRNLVFSIISNNYTCSASEMKKKIEKLLISLAEN